MDADPESSAADFPPGCALAARVRRAARNFPRKNCRGGAHLTAIAIAALVFIVSFGLMQALQMLASQEGAAPAEARSNGAAPAMPPPASSGASSGAATKAGGSEDGTAADYSAAARRGSATSPSLPLPLQQQGGGAPQVYIHVLSEAAREQVRRLEPQLSRKGILLAGIKVVDRGPAASDLRYFRASEREEATAVQAALLSLGLPARRLKRIGGFEATAPPRQYELWLVDDFRE